MAQVSAGPTQESLARSALEGVRGRPLACAVALFALGIWAGAKLGPTPAWAAGAAAAALLVLRHRAGVVVLLLAGIAGGFVYSVSQVRYAGEVSTFDRTARTFEAVILAEPHRWGERQAAPVRLVSRVDMASGKRSPARGRLWLTWPSRPALNRGDLISFTGTIAAPRAPTNPGQTTRAPALQAAGLWALAYGGDERLVRRLGRARLGALERAGIAFREHVAHVMRESMPGPYRDVLGALLAGVVFGAKAHPLPEEIMEAFRRAGVVHVLVVSGAKVSLLFGVVYAPGLVALYYRRRRYGGPRGSWGWIAPAPTQVSLLLVLVLIALYALFTEGGPSVGRAAIAAGVVVLGMMLRKVPAVADHHALEFDRYTILAVAALMLLVARPEGLFDTGLQLSFAAVLGIIYLAPKMMRWLRGLPRWVGFTVAATSSAQLAVLPVTAWHFGYISPVGFVANLVVIPGAALLLATGIAVVALGTVSLPAAMLVNYLNAPLLLWGIRFTHFASELPAATARLTVQSPWPVLAYYLGLGLLAAAADRWWLRRHPEQEEPPA